MERKRVFKVILIRIVVLPMLTLVGASLSHGQEARVLTLPETISMALRQNIGLQRTALQVEQGANTVEGSKGDRQPNLTFSSTGALDYSSTGDDSIFDKDGGDLDESLRASLSSSVTLYDGGSIKGSIQAAEADLEAAQNDYDRERQALLLDTVSAYLEAIVRGKQVQIREEELANQEEQLERIQLDYTNGIRVRSEVLRQEADVASSRGALIESKRLYSVALYALKDILQIPAEEEILCMDPTENWVGAEALDDPRLADSLRSLANRLDLEAQRSRMESARHSVRVAEAGDSIALTASAGLSTSYTRGMPEEFPEHFFSREPSASGALTVSVPIFDRRRTQTNVIRSQILLRQEELYYENLMQVARSDLYRAILNFESAQAQLQAALDQLASAEEALEAEAARYEAGVATLLDLNSIRSTRLDAAVSAEQARFDLFTSRLEVSFEDGTIESFLLAQLENLDASIINNN